MPYHAIACFTLHFQRISLFITHTQGPVLVLTCVASIFLTQLFVNVISARYEQQTIFVNTIGFLYDASYTPIPCPFLLLRQVNFSPAIFYCKFFTKYIKCVFQQFFHIRSVPKRIQTKFLCSNSFLAPIRALRQANSSFSWVGATSSSNV